MSRLHWQGRLFSLVFKRGYCARPLLRSERWLKWTSLSWRLRTPHRLGVGRTFVAMLPGRIWDAISDNHLRFFVSSLSHALGMAPKRLASQLGRELWQTLEEGVSSSIPSSPIQAIGENPCSSARRLLRRHCMNAPSLRCTVSIISSGTLVEKPNQNIWFCLLWRIASIQQSLSSCVPSSCLR